MSADYAKNSATPSLAAPVALPRVSPWRKYLVDPIVGQLHQGATPDALASSIAWGAVLGLFPVLGSTSILCGIAAVRLKLNHIAIQGINWIVYPLQIALIIPFLSLGNALFGIPSDNLSLASITQAFETNFLGALHDLGGLAARGIAAWVLVAIPSVPLLRLILRPVMRRLAHSLHRQRPVSS